MKQTIILDQKKCIHCGLCQILAPDNFGSDSKGKTILINNKLIDKKVNEAIKNCPVQAIAIKQ